MNYTIFTRNGVLILQNTDTNEEYFLGSENLLQELQNNQNISFNLESVNSYLNNVGSVLPSANWRTSELISVDENSNYRYFGRTNIGGAGFAVAGYDLQGNFVSILLDNTINAVNGIDFLVPIGVSSVRLCSFYDTTLQLKKLDPRKVIKPQYIDENYINSIIITQPTQGKEKINKTWASVGTSITANNDNPSLTGYQENVQKVFDFGVNGFTNYGYSGQSLGGTSTSDVSSFGNKLNTWVAHDIFTLESITNDFKRNIPIGTINDYNNDTGITTYYGALRKFKNRIQALNSNAIVIVANALKRNNGGYTSTSSNVLGHSLLDYENALLEVAKLNNWLFIDQYRESGITDENLFATTSDGLHPNNFGYQMLSKVWIDVFWFVKYL